MGEEWIPPADLRAAVVEAASRGDTQAAAELVNRHWDRYATAETAHLLAALRALPGEAFLDNAGLVVAAEYLQHLVQGGEPHRFAANRLAISGARDSGPLEERLILLTSAAASSRTTGDYRESVEAATEARRIVTRATAAEVASISSQLPHLFLQWGRALEVADDVGLDIQFEYEEAYRLALASEQKQIARRAAAHLAWYTARRGWLTAAEKWLHRARTTGVPTPRYEAVAHLAAALIHLDRRKPVESALELARMSAYPIGEYWSAALWVRSWHASTPAERALLEAEIDAERDRHPNAVSLGGSHRLDLRAAWLRLGRPAEPAPPNRPGDHTLGASFEYLRGNFRAAIEAAEPATRPTSPPRARAVALVISAGAALGLKRRSVAAHHFDIARALIENEQLYSAYDHITSDHLHQLIDGTPPVQFPIGRASPDGISPLLATLTNREREVLRLLPSGRTIPDIATELFVSPNTVKATLRRLYTKLNVTSRGAAADIAERAQLGTQTR